MAIFRKVHTSIWSDPFFSDLDKDKKLFYIYLITNERTKQCGVYEITKKQISFDLGYSIDKVSSLLNFFIKKGKVRYNDDTKELALGNWMKYNYSSSPKVQSCINKEFKDVKDTLLIQYVKSMDTASQQEEEQEEEQEEIDYSIFNKFWDFYDKKVAKEKTFKLFSKLTEDELESIRVHLPKYIESTPDKQYRKSPDVYLRNKCWNDEIITRKPKQKPFIDRL